MDEIWILLCAFLVGAACVIPGSFLVLRKSSMLADAISHSILLGIVLAVLVSGSRSSFLLLFFATFIGVLTAFISAYLNQVAKLQSDAAIGVSFTFLFALGVILISSFAGKIDIDLDCVLYGELAFVPLDPLIIANRDFGPKAFYMLLFVALINLIYVALFYKRLCLCAFDQSHARSLGIKNDRWFYSLMILISFTCVAAFEAVGVILVVGMIVIPVNTALFFAKNVWQVIMYGLIAVIFAVFSGYQLAEYYDANIAAAIIIAAAFLFFVMAVAKLFYNKLQEHSRSVL